MSQIVLTSPEQLETLIADAVHKALASMPAQDENVWDWNECAKYLKIGLNKLRELVEDEEIPYFEISSRGTGQKRNIRFHPHEIRAWKPKGARVTVNVRQDRAADFHTAKNNTPW